jgi:actin-related protein
MQHDVGCTGEMMPPKLSMWRAKHKECQAAVDNLKAEYEAKLSTRISFTCQNCGEDFSETLQAFASQRRAEILAPALCVACGHGAEDEE